MTWLRLSQFRLWTLSFLDYETQGLSEHLDQIQETDLLNFKRLVYEPECLFAMRAIHFHYLEFSFLLNRAHLLYMSRETKLVSGWWFEEALDHNKWKRLISTRVSPAKMKYSFFAKMREKSPSP